MMFCLFCWLLNVPATGLCISGTDLLRQFYVLPHWDRSCRSNVLPHPVTVYWHRADQAPGRVPIFKSLVWLDPEKIPVHAGFEPGIFRSRGGLGFLVVALTTRPTRLRHKWTFVFIYITYAGLLIYTHASTHIHQNRYINQHTTSLCRW